MARNWDELSDSYRHRLESHGISRNDYESGAALSSARGHGVTKEALVNEIQNLKADLFGDRRRWNEQKSLKHILKDADGNTRSKADLQAIAKAHREALDQKWSDEPDWMDSLFYQLREDDYQDAGFYN